MAGAGNQHKLVDLFRRASGGDQDAAREFFEQVRERVASRLRIRANLQQHVGYSDILQSAFRMMVAHGDQARATNDRELLAWASRIARNKLLGHLRVRQRSGRLDQPENSSERGFEPADSSGSWPDRRFERELRRESLLRAMAQLPGDTHEVLQMRFFEGLEHREIAERIGCTEAASRMRLSRALESLRAAYGGEE